MANQEKNGVWRTIRGRRIFIEEGQSLSEAMKKSGKFGRSLAQSLSHYSKKLEKLNSPDVPDGTYDLETGKAKEYETGYSVTFSMIGMDFSDEEFKNLVDKFKKADHDTVDAGKFMGAPEISFNVDDKRKALELAAKYNQIAIWDCANNQGYDTSGTGEWEHYIPGDTSLTGEKKKIVEERRKQNG